jgi:choline transport protein
LQHDKASSSFVWFNYNDLSGWPTGVAFLISMAAPVISFAPLDGAVHLVDEVSSPAKVVSRTILTAVAISFITAIIFALAMLYSITDFNELLSTASYFMPFDLWIQATSSAAAAIAFTVSVIIMLPIGSVSCVQVTSIMLWNLANDKAVPYFSSRISAQSRQHDGPIHTAALLANFILIFLIGTLYLGSQLGAAPPLLAILFFVSTLRSDSSHDE